MASGARVTPPEAVRERILGIEQVLPHAGDPGAAGDLRHRRGPAADGRLLEQAAGEAGADDRLVHERRAERRARRGPELGHPSARAGPARRAVDPAGMDGGGRTAVGSVRAGRGPDTCRQPRMSGSSGCTGSSTAAISASPASTSSSACSGRDLEPGGGGVGDGVEVAAVGHVVANARRPPPSVAWRKDGTLRRLTDFARPSSTCTRASTRPAGTSRRTSVSGSWTSTMPVSTSTVATPIVPWPHIGRQPLTSM